MTLRHELFLMQMGLDRMPIRAPESIATIVHAAASEHPRDCVSQAIRHLLDTVPRPGTLAADLNDSERVALAVAAGAPYKTVMDGAALRVGIAVPVGFADRPGGGYIVAIGPEESENSCITSACGLNHRI